MNEEKHWNTIAPSYEEEIFDVFNSDIKKKLPKLFRKYANETHSAIDFGCGVGKAFDYLAPAFKHVLAIDISQACLTVAKRNKIYKNITYKQADLTSSRLKLTQADFALCCNVAILPEVEKNVKIIQNIYTALKPGGAAIFVIPSLDSMLFTAWRLIDWYRKEGVTLEDIPNSEFSGFRGNKRDILQGVVQIENHPTKHYTHSEIEVVFKEAGFHIRNIEKLDYDWQTEFAQPPMWMKDPYPWDWLVECIKK